MKVVRRDEMGKWREEMKWQKEDKWSEGEHCEWDGSTVIQDTFKLDNNIPLSLSHELRSELVVRANERADEWVAQYKHPVLSHTGEEQWNGGKPIRNDTRKWSKEELNGEVGEKNENGKNEVKSLERGKEMM